MHQNEFGGRVPPGPTGELTALPRPPIAELRGRAVEKGDGREGKGREEEGKKEGRGG